MKYFSLAANIKDDEYYIEEWLCFYDLIGVEQFYIVLHNCSDTTEAKIKRLPFYAEKVKLYACNTPNDGKNYQLGSYKELIKLARGNTEWLAMLDGDEYLFGVTEDDIKEIVSLYDEFSGICVNWKLFNSSGHLVRPARPTIKHYTSCLRYVGHSLHPFTRTVKSVIKPHDIQGIYCSHMFDLRGTMVNDAFKILDVADGRNDYWSSRFENSYCNLQINHYYSRSLQDWQARRSRGTNTAVTAASCTDNEFYRLQHAGQLDDLTILRFVPELETRLNEL